MWFRRGGLDANEPWCVLISISAEGRLALYESIEGRKRGQKELRPTEKPEPSNKKLEDSNKTSCWTTPAWSDRSQSRKSTFRRKKRIPRPLGYRRSGHQEFWVNGRAGLQKMSFARYIGRWISFLLRVNTRWGVRLPTRFCWLNFCPSTKLLGPK